MKRCIAILLVIMLLLSNFCIAMPLPKKKETVYINLDSYGKVNQINIYSKWLTNGALTLKDRTNYKTVSNLTNRSEYVNSGDSILWNVSGEKNFTYTGEVNGDYYDLIPWTFDISYKLNGVEVTADELLGAEGLIKITININSNKKANEYYRNNYVLEVTGSYDMSDYLSVESEDAMITDTGNTKTLMFVVLPGQSTTLNIEIGSTNFSMDGITMAMVPITGDIRDKVVDIIEERQDIKDAIKSINTSSDIILNAMAGMTTGLNGVSAGIKEIKEGSKNLHGLNDLRDEDINNLKDLINELIPLLNDVRNDIDNIEESYGILIEFDEKLNSQTKMLSANINQLNEDAEELNSVMKNLPNDVAEINLLLEDTSKVVGSTEALVKKLSGGSSESSESITNDLTSIATETATIGALVQKTIPTVQDEATVGALLKIGDSANNIGTNLKSVQSTLTEMQNSTLSGTKSLEDNLFKLKKQLHDVSDLISKNDAQKLVNVTDSLLEVTKTLEKMVDTITAYNDKLLKNKNDFNTALNTSRNLVNELERVDSISLSMLNNLQSMLNVLSTDFYNGTSDTADAIASLSSQLTKITSQSNQLKKSKDEIKKIFDDKVDDIDEKTTLFNLDKDAKVVSFGSEENEYVDSVQFVLKTPDIKNVKVDNEDLEESNKENVTFWQKVSLIFKKIIEWITGIFK